MDSDSQIGAPEQGGPQLRSRVKAGVVWSTLSFAVTKVLAFASLLVLTRILSPRQFGLVAAVTIVLSVIELTADLGMAAAVIYEQGDGVDERVQTAFTLNMMFTIALTAAALVLAPQVAAFFHVAHHTGLFRLAALDVLLTGLGNIPDALLLRDLRMSKRIATQVIAAVVRAGVGVTLALMGLGAASLVWGFLAGTAAWSLSLWWVTRFRPTWRLSRSAVRDVGAYGVGAASLELAAQLTIQADSTVVGKVLGARALGIYTVAFRLPSLLLENIAVQVSLVAFPALSRKRVTERDGLARSTATLVRYQSLYALPLAAGMAVQAAPLVDTIFSSRWHAASGVFAAISVMSGISASGFALGDAFKALGRQRVMVVLNLIQFPVLIATIILVAPYGITTVAWARAASVAFWVLLMALAARRILTLPVGGTLGAMVPGAIAAAAVALAAGAIRFTGLPAVPELLLAALAGAASAVLALLVCSPWAAGELRAGWLAVRRRLRGGDRLPGPAV